MRRCARQDLDVKGGVPEFAAMQASVSATAKHFDGLVFAGGGCRCFWQAGFYSQLHADAGVRPKVVAAASAGASIAALALTGLAERGLEVFKTIARDNKSNLHWREALRGQPVFPHAALFRRAIVETIDTTALAALRRGPMLRIALTRAPRSRFGIVPRMALGFTAYQLERRFTGRLHSRWPSKLGFTLEFANANDCATTDELADLLLHTSCTPPFTPRLQRAGSPVIDGGLMDNVPVAALPECERILVLLTRPHPSPPSSLRVHYAQPSQEIPVEKWDYTRPDAIQRAFDLGQKDGQNFVSRSH